LEEKELLYLFLCLLEAETPPKCAFSSSASVFQRV
jgi:hypothetical protein